MRSACEDNGNGRKAAWPLWVRAGLVVLVVALGAFLRGYRLAEQSVWLDEYASIGFVDAPDLASYLHDQRDMNDEMVPFYFVLQYYWAHWVGSSAVSARWLSILFGLLAIPLLYRLGREVSGEWAGLMAALLLALSPFHIFHDQEIRVYSLMTLLGLVSAYAFLRVLGAPLRVLRGGHGGPPPALYRAWWALNLVANVLLMYTHLLGCWLLAVEGLFLVLFRFGQVRRIAAWAAVHALLLLPLVLLVMSWDFDPRTGVLPGLSAVGANLYGIDVERTRWAAGHLNSLEAGATLQGFAPTLLRHFGALRTALIGTVLAGLILLFIETCARRSRKAVETLSFLLMWHVLPAVMLYAFAWAWSAELFQFRYTLYSSLALYLLLGAAVATLRWAPVRAVLGTTLVALFGLHAYLGMHLPQRTDYISAARLLETLAGPQDAVIFHPNDLKPAFEFNLLGGAVAQRGPHSFALQSSVDMSALLELTDAELEGGKDVVVILVDAGHFIGITETPQARSTLFERYLTLRGISHTLERILGENDICVYACRRGPDYHPLGSSDGLKAFRASIKLSPHEILFQFAFARALARSSCSEEAIEVYRRALGLVPRDAATRMRLAKAHQRSLGQVDGVLNRHIFEGTSALIDELLECGRIDEALEAWRDAAGLLPNDNLPGYVVERLAIQQTLALSEALIAAGRAPEAAGLCRQALALFPGHKLLRLELARCVAASGDAERAAALLREAQRPGADTVATRCLEGDVLFMLGNLDDALLAYRQAVALDPEAFQPYEKLDALHLRHGGQERWLEECRRLAEIYTASGRAQFHLGRALKASGLLAEAAEAYRKASALQPEDPAFAAHLGETLMALGDFQGAVAPLRQALRLNPDIAHLRPLLVQALIETGDHEAARAELAECERRGIALPPETKRRVEAWAEEDTPLD